MSPYEWSAGGEAVVLVPLLALAYWLSLRIRPATRRQQALFAAGLVLLVLAFVTPLEQLALHYLLLAHLLQNVVLAEWAPLLLVAGIPAATAAALTRGRWLGRLTHPAVSLPLWIATYFAWHVPWAYDAALRHPSWLLHLEHLCYLATGILFWWPVLQPAPRRLSSALKAVYCFGAFVLAAPLGLLLALLPDSIYTFYEAAPRIWGLDPLGDQRFAGITMASEQAAVLFAFFAVFFLRFLREEEARGVTARRS